MKPILNIRATDGQQRSVDLSTMPSPVVIGRDGELSQIVVADSQVSRAHCVIGREGKLLQVEDLGSRNGTLLNDKRVMKAVLRHHDVIKIGGTAIQIDLVAPQGDDPLIGKRLGGFELQSVLGKGRYGTVYRGVQVALGRQVAVKVLGVEYRSEPDKVQAFLTEARRAGRLNHPNLVQVHDVCQVEEHYLLIMELMKCSAADQLRQQGKLPEPPVLGLISDVAKALGYAESQRLVHRDVKPDNVLVNEEGVYKLADLGIATAIAADGQAHQERTFGSPHYVAPEQARGGAIDGRADLYALGASAWHLLVGAPMFTGSTRQIVAAHISTEPPDLEELAPELSEGMVELIYDLLAKNPDDRPENAQAVAKRVDELAKQSSEPTTQRPRIRRRMRRRRR